MFKKSWNPMRNLFPFCNLDYVEHTKQNKKTLFEKNIF